MSPITPLCKVIFNNFHHLKVCKDWDIPFISLDETQVGNIAEVVAGMEIKPRVVLATISKINDEAVQRQIRRLPICTICLDEVQVLCMQPFLTVQQYIFSKVINSDSKIGWGGFLPFWYSCCFHSGLSLFNNIVPQAVVVGLPTRNFPSSSLLLSLSHFNGLCRQGHSK